MNDTVYEYRVVHVDDEGSQFSTVSLGNSDYAQKLWARTNSMQHVARCWIERRPVAPWRACSSEAGTEFMVMRPASPSSQLPKEDTDGR
jgi:hypothetical protein